MSYHSADDTPDAPQSALDQILQELRVIQTGVQILSAFLLTLPFTVRFGTASTFEKADYVLTLVAAAVTTALVIAPVSYHRWRLAEPGRLDLRDVVRTASRLAQLGMATLFLAVIAGVLLALEVSVGVAYAIPVTVVLTAIYVGVWYVLPFLHRRRP